MKIHNVAANNRKKGFSVRTRGRVLWYPYAKLDSPPSAKDPLVDVAVDPEVGREGFTYRLKSGKEGVVLSDQVLEYNQDPGYLRNLLLYKLTLEAQKRLAASRLSRREIIRRLRTSATQFYRLLDQANDRKSIDQMLTLLHILDCEVELIVRAKSA